MGATSPLQDLIVLAQEPSSARRRELLRRVTDIFQSADPTPSETIAFDGVFCRLAEEVETDVRVELAERFGTASRVPAELAARLARDCIEVALPILSNANVLSEADLLDVARSQGQLHLRAVSTRVGLSEAVSDVIVERGDDETLNVLVQNEQASLSRQAHETVVARAASNPDLQAAVIGRASLPLDLANELYFIVEERLRERIRTRNASADPAAVEAALQLARARLSALACEPDEAAEAEVEKLIQRRRLDGHALLNFLRGGQRERFCAGLARLSGVGRQTVRTVMERADLDALAILCKAIDIEKAMFLTFGVLLGSGRDAMTRASAYAKVYGDLPQEAAQRTLRFWRVRSDSEAMAA